MVGQNEVVVLGSKVRHTLVIALSAVLITGLSESGFAAETVAVRVATPKQLQQAIAAHRGKPVLVDFWATWCVPCLKGFPHTVELHEKYAKQGLVVISVSMDDPDEDTQQRVLKYLKKQKAVFPNYLSSLGGEEEAMQAFGVTGKALPFYRLYDKNGAVAKEFGADPEASFSHKDIEAAVKSVLK